MEDKITFPRRGIKSEVLRTCYEKGLEPEKVVKLKSQQGLSYADLMDLVPYLNPQKG